MLRMKHAVLFVVLAALLSLPLGSALAQGGEMPPVFCGELSAEDCAILEQSQAAMASVSSSAMSLQLDMALTGIEDMGDDLALSLLVDGAFAVDPALMERFGQTLTPEMMSEMMMSQDMTLVVEMLQGIEGEANLRIMLPAQLSAETGMPLDSLKTTLIMVDGVLYANLESLIPAEAMDEDEMQMPAWMGLDLAGMYEMMAEMPMDEMDDEMEDFQELFSSEELAALYDYQAWGDYMTITRLEDAEVMGQPMAVFNMVLDYQAMFSSEAIQEIFGTYMEQMMEMQDVDADEIPDNFMEVITAMMGGMSVETTQWIGLEDYYMHRFTMDFGFALDAQALAELEPDAAEELPENFNMWMALVVDSSAFNEPVEVLAPAEAQVINPMMFMDMDFETTD